jgi:AraC family transcriptional regulator
MSDFLSVAIGAGGLRSSNPDQDGVMELRQTEAMNALAQPTAPRGPLRQTELLETVLRYIEQHLFEPLSVGSLAEFTGLSPYHFSRMFTAQVGESVMAHVRRQRMLRAAARLGDNPGAAVDTDTPALIDLAFDCGFESQEAFTRAFKQVFGVTPGRFRRDPAREQSAAREYAMSQTAIAKPSVTQLEGITKKDAFLVAGLSARIGKDNMLDIPALWPALMRHVPVPGQKGKVGYGLCYGSNTEEGSFNYMAAVEVEPGTKPPVDLTLMQVPAQSYLVFRITLGAGEIHPQMQRAMKYIFGEGLPESGHKPSGGIDLEVYGERFEPNKAGSILDFYIPVEG